MGGGGGVGMCIITMTASTWPTVAAIRLVPVERLSILLESQVQSLPRDDAGNCASQNPKATSPRLSSLLFGKHSAALIFASVVTTSAKPTVDIAGPCIPRIALSTALSFGYMNYFLIFATAHPTCLFESCYAYNILTAVSFARDAVFLW